MSFLGLLPKGFYKRLSNVNGNHPFVSYRLTKPLRRLATFELDRRSFNEAQIALVSFPKCGRTWLRVVLGKIVYDHFALNNPEYLFLTSEQLNHAGLGPIYITHDGINSWHPDKTSISANKTKYKNHKVILLTRDLRAIATSYYFHMKTRYGVFEGEISDFLRSPWGIKIILDFHKAWFDNQHIPSDFLLVKYEDMHMDIKPIICQILDLMEIRDVPHVTILNAIEFGRFNNLKKLEQDNVYPATELSYKTQKGDNAMKVRQGEIRGFADQLTKADINYIEEQLFDHFPELTAWLWNA